MVVVGVRAIVSVGDMSLYWFYLFMGNVVLKNDLGHPAVYTWTFQLCKPLFSIHSYKYI